MRVAVVRGDHSVLGQRLATVIVVLVLGNRSSALLSHELGIRIVIEQLVTSRVAGRGRHRLTLSRPPHVHVVQNQNRRRVEAVRLLVLLLAVNLDSQNVLSSHQNLVLDEFSGNDSLGNRKLLRSGRRRVRGVGHVDAADHLTVQVHDRSGLHIDRNIEHREAIHVLNGELLVVVLSHARGSGEGIAVAQSAGAPATVFQPAGAVPSSR